MSEWISVNKEMPPPLKDVQIVQIFEGTGNRAQMVGRYIPAFTEESLDDTDGWEEYNEDDDTYYTPAGWYEVQNNWGEFAYIHCSEGPVTHWKHLDELPEPPK